MKRMKKLLTLTLSLFMAFSLCLTISATGGGDDNNATSTTTTNVAKIGEQEYSTLQAALNDAKDGDTVDLQDNITVSDLTVTGEKTITLDMTKIILSFLYKVSYLLLTNKAKYF